MIYWPTDSLSLANITRNKNDSWIFDTSPAFLCIMTTFAFTLPFIFLFISLCFFFLFFLSFELPSQAVKQHWLLLFCNCIPFFSLVFILVYYPFAVIFFFSLLSFFYYFEFLPAMYLTKFLLCIQIILCLLEYCSFFILFYCLSSVVSLLQITMSTFAYVLSSPLSAIWWLLFVYFRFLYIILMFLSLCTYLSSSVHYIYSSYEFQILPSCAI